MTKPLTKIATCSYCQARAVISIASGSRHELVCTACGAPLDQTEIVQTPQREAPEPARQDKPKRRSDSREREHKKRKPKHKRGLRYWIRKIADEIEDFFD